MMLRAEKNSIMLLSGDWDLSIPEQRYPVLESILDGVSPKDDDEERWRASLGKSGHLAWIRANPGPVRDAMRRSATVAPPPNAYCAPVLINLELTTRCPLRCPQCYCDLERGRDLPLDIATSVLRQAAALRVGYVNLSGGETMVYPHLHRLIEECSSLGLNSAVALSGYGVDGRSVRKLIDCGVDRIYVSLNGSTEEISRATRDGFHLAIEALRLLSESGFGMTAVNWVAHRANAGDFANVVAICRRYGVRQLVVMAFKPDSSHAMEGAPDGAQTLALAEDIRRLRNEAGELSIEVESCYSPLRAHLARRFFGNVNVGATKGCGAGRDSASLDVNGNFTPCRHLDYSEKFDTLMEYWNHSPVLARLRNVEEDPAPPCDECGYRRHCLSCVAVNAKLKGRLVKGNDYCSLWKEAPVA
jgi:pyrroloquinoline quinone biosynthesis protein E